MYWLLHDPHDPNCRTFARIRDVPPGFETQYVLNVISNQQYVRRAFENLCSMPDPSVSHEKPGYYEALQNSLPNELKPIICEEVDPQGFQVFSAVNLFSTRGEITPVPIENFPGVRKEVAKYLNAEIAHYRKIVESVY